jgi:hypothetical protein
LEYFVHLDFHDKRFVGALLFASLGGVLLSISKIAANVTLMPVTVSVLGMANHLLVTSAGFMFFKDVDLTVNMGIGIGISLLGILIYTLKNMCTGPKGIIPV